MIKRDDVVKIGQFAKPHGVKGELTLVTECDVFDDADEQFVVCDLDGILVPFFVESFRYKTDSTMLLKLEGVDTDKEAAEFSNCEVFVPLDRVDESELVGDITWDNFVGFEVIDETHGVLGIITDVDESTCNVLFQVEDHHGKELLIPAAEELVSDVDYEQKKIVVTVPDGLLAL